MKNKRDVLITNLLINEDTCDSFCQYCYYRDEIVSADHYLYEGHLKTKIAKLLHFADENFAAPLIKICGGEIFLMSNLREFVMELLTYYQYVLIQTNGLHMNDENLEWIIDSKRIFIQISLDGHNLEMNEYRFSKSEVMEKQLRTIEILKANDVYLELVCVLNNRNTGQFREFIEYIDSIPGGERKNALKITPLLIIDKEKTFAPSKEDLTVIDQVIQEYERFSHILPPKIYLEKLSKILHGGTIKYQCFNPIASLNMIEDGQIKCCTNIKPDRAINIGDLREDSPQKIMNNFGKTPFQKLLLTTQQKIPVCKNCLNFCTLYNLYFNDSISLEELCENNYLFGLPELKEQLQKLKEQMILEIREIS